MRPAILEHGHRLLQKIQLWLVRRYVGYVPGPIALLSYRRELFGRPYAASLHAAMCRAQEWRRGELELFGAFVSKLNHCVY